MAPQAVTSIISQVHDKEMTLEYAEMKPKEVCPPKEQCDSIQESNDKSRKVLKKCLSHLRSTLNVLVTGAEESGKTCCFV